MHQVRLWNEDIHLSFVFSYILFSIVLIAIDCNNIGRSFPVNTYIAIPEYNIFEMMTFHLQTMCFISTVMGYFISKIDSRIMGLSIKYLVIKRHVYNFNLSTWFIILILTGLFAILGFVATARWFLVFNLFIMLFALLRVLYFVYLISLKMSIIYKKVMEGIRKNRKFRENLFEKWESYPFFIIREGSQQNSFEIIAHNSYIVEELSILQLLRHYAGPLTNDQTHILRDMALYIISKDTRGFEDVLKVVRKYAGKYLSLYEKNGFEEWLLSIRSE